MLCLTAAVVLVLRIAAENGIFQCFFASVVIPVILLKEGLNSEL